MIRAHWEDTVKAGGCNFCHFRRERVLVVRSDEQTCTLEARLCRTCLAELKRQGKP